MEPMLAIELARIGADLIAKLILAGKQQEADAVREILGRAGANFNELVNWSERP